MSGHADNAYQYLVLRCVPRVDREEFVNVGVVLYCQRAEFLDCASHLDPARLLSLGPDLDLDAVAEAMRAVEAVCRGDSAAGLAGAGGLRDRFGYLAAPRSTVLQPGPVHGGVIDPDAADPGAALDHLLTTLVRTPARHPQERRQR